MAGKAISKEDLQAAVKAYCTASGRDSSMGEDGKIRIFAGSPDPATDKVLWLEGGNLRTNDPDFALSFAEDFLVSPVNGRSQMDKAIMPSNGRKAGNGALVKPGAVITEEDIRNYLCPNASPQEILMAAKMCQLRGMNWGDVHFIKYGNSPLTIVAGKEHFTKKAEANTQFDGFKAGIIVRGKDGSLQEREGTFYLDEELVGGWASVWRKDRKEPFVQKVRLSAFDTKKALWAKMPEVMIRKCALVNALREAFPGDLGGVYDSSEMGQAIDADFEEMGAA